MERKQSKKVKALGASRQGKAVTKSNMDSEIARVLRTDYSYSKGIIPPMVSNPIHRRRVRWTFTTNFSGNVTQADFHNQFLVATTSTALNTYVDAWRVRRMRIYLRNNEGDYPVQCQFTLNNVDPTNNNASNDPQKSYFVQSQSTAFASILTIKPGLGDALGKWRLPQSGSSGSWSMFNIATSSGGGSIDPNSYFEVDFEFTLNLAGAPKTYTVTGSGLTAGELYGASIAGGLIALETTNKAF